MKDYDDEWESYCEGPDDGDMDRPQFARSGSALRAATKDNPRNLPCPSCGKPDRLTPEDRRHGYQCDECADQAERGF